MLRFYARFSPLRPQISVLLLPNPQTPKARSKRAVCPQSPSPILWLYELGKVVPTSFHSDVDADGLDPDSFQWSLSISQEPAREQQCGHSRKGSLMQWAASRDVFPTCSGPMTPSVVCASHCFSLSFWHLVGSCRSMSPCSLVPRSLSPLPPELHFSEPFCVGS